MEAILSNFLKEEHCFDLKFNFCVQEWETVEKTFPDGTKKPVRRRIVVAKKPNGDDDEKSPIEEVPIKYEEVDVDEANPEDEKYDPKVNKKVFKSNFKEKYFRKNYIVYNNVFCIRKHVEIVRPS